MDKLKEKKEVVNNFKEMFSKSTFTIVTDYRGFTVAEITDLRKRLRKDNADYKIAKNTLMRLAAKETNLSELENLLEGPTAILLGYGDPTACAKTFVEFIKEIEKGQIKGGMLDGKLISKDEIKIFASLPAKEVLLSQIAGLLTANAASMVGIFESLIRDIALLAEEVAKKNSGNKE